MHCGCLLSRRAGGTDGAREGGLGRQSGVDKSKVGGDEGEDARRDEDDEAELVSLGLEGVVAAEGVGGRRRGHRVVDDGPFDAEKRPRDEDDADVGPVNNRAGAGVLEEEGVREHLPKKGGASEEEGVRERLPKKGGAQ